jgi:methylmalonyl-CoA carboxyltransferase large subunit
LGYILVPLGLLAGWLAGSYSARRIVREELKLLRPELLAQAPVQPAAPAPLPVIAAPALAAVADEEVSPEILMVLSAAVAAFLGKRARIRHARMASPYGAGAWAQQGRVFVQASHNLPHRSG